ncbi:MAG: hypothetical protein AABY86_18260, partial [Bdellovibrionota bacterium]
EYERRHEDRRNQGHEDQRAFQSTVTQTSGMHTMRHTMANLVREHLSLDHANPSEFRIRKLH